MNLYLVKKTLLFSAFCMLASCSLFADKKIDIEGERVSALEGETSLQPDFKEGEIKIKLPAPIQNSQWAMSGGNSTHLMQHLETGHKIKEKWDSNFGEGNSKRNFLIASPVIAYRVVFAIDADGVVSSYRLDDGEQIWERKLKPLNKDDKNIAIRGAGVAVYDKKVYATTGFGGVFAMDMITGKLIWRYDTTTPIRVAPTVNQNRVFVQTIDNFLIAIDATDGTEVWKHKGNFEPTTLVGGASVAYSPEMDVAIAAFTNGELRAFKASTGTPLWADYLVSKKRTNSLANINAIKANPVIDGEKVYAVGHNNILVAIDLRTGQRIWEREIGSVNQPWVAGQYMYVLSNDFDLFAIENESGKIVWNTKIPTGEDEDNNVGIFATGPVLTSNRLLVTTSNGFVFAISPYTGKILGYKSLPDGVELSPIVADSNVVFTTNEADLINYK